MEENETGYLVVSVKKSEMLVIDTGEDKIEIFFYDRFKQPLDGKLVIKSIKKYKINRRPKVKETTA